MSGKRKNTTAETGPAAKAQAVAVAGDAPGSASATPAFVGVPPSPSKTSAVKPAALQAVAAAVAATGAATTSHTFCVDHAQFRF
jgi:hypothetical protein